MHRPFPLFAFLVACGGTPGPKPSDEKSAEPPPAATAPAEQPDEATSLDVETVDVAGLDKLMRATSGKPRVYNFWATWCGPCVVEMPMLRDFGREQRHLDVVFVNVDHPSMWDRKVVPLLERNELTDFRHVQVVEDDIVTAMRDLEGWPDVVPVTIVVTTAGERLSLYDRRLGPADLTRISEITR